MNGLPARVCVLLIVFEADEVSEKNRALLYAL